MIEKGLKIILGSTISALAINIFITPHSLISGGVGGIALIIQYITGISSGVFVFLLNIPIFLIGMKRIDKSFIILSFAGMMSLSVMLVITKDIGASFSVRDTLLSSIYAGVFNGLGIGIVLSARGSMGGTDILAVAAKKKTGANISTLSFGMNLIVVTIGAILTKNFQVALYTLVAMYISSVVLDRVIQGVERKKLLLIVTSSEQEVSRAIMEEIGRGVTFLYGEGAYTGDKKRILYCIVTSKQLVRVKHIIEEADHSCFMSIIDTGEVEGRGFKKPLF
jgi:uncharacterized membrane-anchored protein YitT (DUF2179 family)